ncbi:MAG: TPM domain-containing protein [Bacteroidota bacterium]|nr:TPM domain-containing protein [Bacteroidota bacterium]
MSHFLSPAEDLLIVEAVQLAEKGTSGEIRVHFAKKIKKDVLTDAKNTFEELKMHQTKVRNGVLIYMVLQEKQFSIIGDIGIDQKTGDSFWQSCRNAMQIEFSKGEIALGIIKGIEAVKEVLKKDFPYQNEDVNELSDEISKDE